MRLHALIVAAIAIGSLSAAEKPKIALHVGKVITCAGEPITDATILIADGKIQAIGPRENQDAAGIRGHRSQ